MIWQIHLKPYNRSSIGLCVMGRWRPKNKIHISTSWNLMNWWTKTIPQIVAFPFRPHSAPEGVKVLRSNVQWNRSTCTAGQERPCMQASTEIQLGWDSLGYQNISRDLVTCSRIHLKAAFLLCNSYEEEVWTRSFLVDMKNSSGIKDLPLLGQLDKRRTLLTTIKTSSLCEDLIGYRSRTASLHDT